MTISQFPIPTSGIPTGATGDRPANPSTGDVFYNGTLSVLEIYNGSDWVSCSAPGPVPTIAVADVGTSVAYGSAQGVVTITPGTLGGPVQSYLIASSSGGYTATTTGTTVTITVGNSGSWTFSGQSRNSFGSSVSSNFVSATLTTVPEAPTIGTATTSGSTTDITVTWALANNGGKNLSSITITPYLNGTTAQTSVAAATTTATSVVVTGLTVGSSYTFKVKTANANGDSLESSATNSVGIPIFLDFLVIAGGGGAGNNNSGGGGAGGYRTSAGTSGRGAAAENKTGVVKGTNYTVTVGGGGASAVDGSNSVFSTVTSTGGGAAFTDDAAGNPGGSGGGGSDGGAGGAGTTAQGFNGGNSFSNTGGAGGGGAGAVGNAYNGSTGDRNGGAGLASTITGSSVTRGGGGGGEARNGGSEGVGGAGGGGSANTSGGTANTGGGGGGGGFSGGSGVVILRWPTAAATISVGAGLTADATGTDGSNSYKVFTAGSGNVSFS
jgi:hypothetical protein